MRDAPPTCGPLRPDSEREDVISDANGTITFNYLQQHEEGFDPGMPATPLEEAGTTDPDGITTG